MTNNSYAENTDNENAQNLYLGLSYKDFTFEGSSVDREKTIPTASYDTVLNDPRTMTKDERTYFDLKYQRLLEKFFPK